MTTQEKNKAIAEWLGLEKHYINEQYWIKKDLIDWQPNKDRNQQKLIEDKLIEMGFDIRIDYFQFREINWAVTLMNGKGIHIRKYNKSKDIAFIDAVIELINLNETNR
jgi:hypothetical protein